jgi:hypothetical protein
MTRRRSKHRSVGGTEKWELMSKGHHANSHESSQHAQVVPEFPEYPLYNHKYSLTCRSIIALVVHGSISTFCAMGTIQLVPHRKHIKSPLQSPTRYCCLGKQSLFIVRTIRNTQIHSVGRMQSFSMVNKMVYTVLYIVTTRFKRLVTQAIISWTGKSECTSV